MQQPGNSLRLRRPGRVRWWIVWTLFFSTVTDYLPVIYARELPIFVSNSELASHYDKRFK
jgi:hypothetical protein